MNTSVPKIDHLAGIQCYCTCFNGIYGLIKQNSINFKVSEIIDESFLDGVSSVQDQYHRFPLYTLYKKNIDSNHALFEIKRELGIKLKILGIKDSKAATKQFASSEQTKNVLKEINTKHTRLTLNGFTKKPLKRPFFMGMNLQSL